LLVAPPVAGAAMVALMVQGRLTLDTGWGRSHHRLGPVTVRVAAPRAQVFDHLAAPYLGPPPRPLQQRIEIIDGGVDMVIARHLTPLYRSTTRTVESVRFEAPERITFRNLRGPVPEAVETYVLHERDGVTDLVYDGEFSMDFWAVGRFLGRHWIRPQWLGIVEPYLDDVTRHFRTGPAGAGSP
jgi:hypothetical protein